MTTTGLFAEAPRSWSVVCWLGCSVEPGEQLVELEDLRDGSGSVSAGSTSVITQAGNAASTSAWVHPQGSGPTVAGAKQSRITVACFEVMAVTSRPIASRFSGVSPWNVPVSRTRE